MAHIVLTRPHAMTKANSTIPQTRLGRQKTALALVGFLFATACATYPPPTDTLANAIAAVRGAEEVGAEEIPQAALALQLAREEIAKARALMAEEENEPAYYLALRATSDADLALALVREEQARKEAEAAAQRVGAVEDEAKSEVKP
jgi:hypothetical protein